MSSAILGDKFNLGEEALYVRRIYHSPTIVANLNLKSQNYCGGWGHGGRGLFLWHTKTLEVGQEEQ